MKISTEEFARIWKKETNELTRLDYFTFLLINELHSQLVKGFFDQKTNIKKYHLTSMQISELTIQIGDSLQFFYEQMCFGKGCSLGCPNKLDKPFSSKEEDERQEIIRVEFNGKAKACSDRESCLQHDLMNYVISDTLIDFYTYNMNLVSEEKDPFIKKLATFIANLIIRITYEHGTKFLKDPYKQVG